MSEIKPANIPMKRQAKILSVVFSFRNEEEVLPELISRIRSVLNEQRLKGLIAGHELIFVNDASTDRSLDVLLEHAKGHDDIRVINMSRCFGVSPCVMAGMEYASGDAVVYMDADLQDPPEIIGEMLQVWSSQDEIDVVHTVRKSRKGEPKLKLFFTRIGYILLHRVASVELPIEAGDFKLLSRRAVNHLIRLREKRPYMRGLVCWIGFKHAFVPYDRAPRYKGKAKFPIFTRGVINNFLESALISFSSAPLKIAIVLGFFSILIDFGLIIHAFWEKFHGRAIPGWTALMISVLFVGGIQFFCMGIIGLYVNSIYEESKGRPNYIIESTYGFIRSPHQEEILHKRLGEPA